MMVATRVATRGCYTWCYVDGCYTCCYTWLLHVVATRVATRVVCGVTSFLAVLGMLELFSFSTKMKQMP